MTGSQCPAYVGHNISLHLSLFLAVECEIGKVKRDLNIFCLCHCKEFQLLAKEETRRVILAKKSEFGFLYVGFKMPIRYTSGDIESIDGFI